MQNRSRIVLAITLLVMTACSKPDFRDVEGNAIYLEELKEQWLIVNYWATWCGPCIAEIPELNELSHEYAGRLNLIGVNFDHPEGAEQAAQVRKMKIEFPVLTTEPAAMLNINIPLVLPTTYIFAPGGRLLKQFTGPQTKKSLLAVIDTTDPD